MPIKIGNVILYNSSNRPQPINYQATISAPHMHAYALEYLKDQLISGNRVLDVGYGSGYLYSFQLILIFRTVAFSKMMDDKGLVVGIEHIPQLCTLGLANISKSHSNLLDDKKIILIEGDGRLGSKDNAPYNCIHVGAGNLFKFNLAADTIPQNLIDQLAKGGRMMIPVGKEDSDQYIYLVDKDNQGNISKQKLLGVRYVPLTSKENQVGY